MNGLLDPREAALLTLGMGLLRGSGPSRMPNPLGSILGGAGDEALKSYQGAAQLQMQSQLRDAQMREMLAQAQEREARIASERAQREYLSRPDVQSLLAGGNYTGALAGMPNLSPANVVGMAGIEQKRKGEWSEPYEGPRGTLLQRNVLTGETKQVVSQEPNKPEPLKPVELNGQVVYVPQSQAAGKPVGRPGQASKSLPANAIKDLGEKGESVTTFTRLTDTFKDDYAGKGAQALGTVQNLLGRNIGGGYADQANWWQDYQRQKNVVRNKLFGSALTANETAEFEKADINPGMTSEVIKKNLERQNSAARRAARKLAKAYAAGGYSSQQIEESLGFSLEDLEAPQQKKPWERYGGS